MENRSTKYWENNKELCPYCLCYNEERGLYLERFSEEKNSPEILFRPHGFIGQHSIKREIPSQNTVIEIESKFYDAGSTLHLNASIEKNGYLVLDYDTKKLNIINRCSVSKIAVPVYQWELLFNNIIDNYRNADSNTCNTSIIGYIDALEEMIDQKKILVKGFSYTKEYKEWEGDFLVALHTGNKICDLVENLQKALPIDDIVKKHLKQMCVKFLFRLSSIDLDLNDKRIYQMSKSLLSIHKFLNYINEDKEYLKFFQHLTKYEHRFRR